MEVGFTYTEAGKKSPVVIEQVFAEKPNGGMVANSTFDLMQGVAVGLDGEIFKPIKCYELLKAVAEADTSIEIAKGSGVAVGDIIGHGKKAVACTAVVTSNGGKDIVTVTLGVAIPAGRKLYQAKAAHATAALPIYTPQFVIGNNITAGGGDTAVRLINGANLRRSTAPIADEVVALLSTINLV